MPSILFSASDPMRVERGEFFCPQCLSRRSYQRTRVRRAVAVFSIPLLRYGKRGEYVECTECLGTFRPEVLAYEGGPATPQVMAEYQRTMKRLLALMVMVDGRIREPEIEVVRVIFENLTGRALRRADVLEEVDEVGRAPITVMRFLAGVVGYLNDYGKEQILRAAALVSRSDGFVHYRESHMAERIAGVMGIAPGRVAEVLAELN